MTARVLVIEDNPQNLELMCFLLQSSGHETLVARNGQQGLEVASTSAPDLILCDIQMPVLDGFGVIEQLRLDPRLRGIPCVAVTALAMPLDRERALAAGFDGYLSKPIEPRTFIALIEGFLSTRGGLQPEAKGV